MNKIAVVLASLLLVSVVRAEGGRRMLLQCRGVATSSSSSSRGGRSFGISFGSSRSSSQSNQAQAEVITEAVAVLQAAEQNLSPPGDQAAEDYCPSALAIVQNGATAIATAQAEVYVRSQSYVQVEGNGQATAANDVCAESEARAFANALVSAVARADIGISSADAEAVVNGQITAFARAFATASTTASVTGTGRAEAFQTSFARASLVAVASVVVELIAEVDCEESFTDIFGSSSGEIQSEDVVAETDGSSSVDGNGNASGDGDAGARTGPVTAPSSGKR